MLNCVLRNRERRRVAVIVNDMGEVNVDSDLVRAGIEPSRTDKAMVEMANGCIRRMLLDNLLVEVHRLAAEGSSWDSMPERLWPQHRAAPGYVASNWQEPWRDRRK